MPVTVRKAELDRHLGPFERTVYGTALRIGSWDPELLAGEKGIPRDAAGVDRAIARIRGTLTFLIAGRGPAERSKVGNGVTKGGAYPAAKREWKEQDMESSMNFAERVRKDAEAEAARVLAELERLRFDAHQVTHVMRALGIPVPLLVAALADATADAPERPVPPPVVPPVVVPEPPVDDEPVGEPEPVKPRPEVRKSVLPPGQEAPEHLQPMPSMRGKGPLAPRLRVAKEEYAVLQAVNAAETSITSEVVKRLGGELNDAKAGVRLRALADAGMIRRTGRSRFGAAGRPPAGGRASVEYAPVQEPKPDASDAQPVEDGGPEAAAVRDFAVGQAEGFTVRQLVDATEIPEERARVELTALLRRGVVEYVGMDDLELYAYVKPQGPGAAAELDRRRPAEGSVTHGSVPVAGTGKPMKVSHSEVAKLVRDAESAGCVVTHASNGHFAVKTPDGKRLVISATPSNPRSVLNDRARLRKAGVKV